jgi:CRISPR-associated protein Csy2
MTAYLIIRNLDLQDLNAEGNGFTIGASMLITSACGFAEAFRRRVPDLISDVSGIAVAVSRFHLHGERQGLRYDLTQTRNPNAMHGLAKSKDKILNPPIQPEAKADATLSLILQIEPTGLYRPIIDALEQWLPTARFAGGTLHGHDPLTLPLDNEARLLDTIRRWGTRAWFLVDRADILLDRPADMDTLDALLDALAQTQDGEQTWRRAQAGWVVPLAVGYQGIETPTQRPGRRDDAASHLYASSITGLAEFVSAARCARESERYPVFWRQHWFENSATSLVSALPLHRLKEASIHG